MSREEKKFPIPLKHIINSTIRGRVGYITFRPLPFPSIARYVIRVVWKKEILSPLYRSIFFFFSLFPKFIGRLFFLLLSCISHDTRCLMEFFKQIKKSLWMFLSHPYRTAEWRISTLEEPWKRFIRKLIVAEDSIQSKRSNLWSLLRANSTGDLFRYFYAQFHAEHPFLSCLIDGILHFTYNERNSLTRWIYWRANTSEFSGSHFPGCGFQPLPPQSF